MVKMLSKANIKIIISSIFILILSNISMFLLAYWTGSERSLINIDYFITLLFVAMRQKILFILSFVSICFFDFLSVFSQIFPFVRLVDIIYLLKFSFISSNIYKIYGIILILFLFFQIIIILRFYKNIHNKLLLIFFNISILIYGYNVYFGSERKVSFWKPDNKGVVASQLLNYLDYRNRGFIKTYDVSGDALQGEGVKVNGASVELFDVVKNKKVLLVVNESWGVPIDPAIQQDVLLPLLENKQLFDIQQGILKFDGFTIGGELRELCQKAPVHFNLKNQLTGFENCLPNLYQQAGYQTVAVHGALGLMYDREYWYPRAGFQKMLFRDQGLNLPKSHCYSFPGNCDRDIAIRIQDEFKQNDKLFLYWLTLTTHAIYDERDIVVDLFDCTKYGVKNNTASCRNLKLQKQFFDTLSKMIEHPEFKDTIVIVVGDHTPPILREEKSVFRESEVAYIKFKVD